MTVPYFGVAREFAACRDELMTAIEEVLATGRVLQGPAVESLEAALADLTGRARAVAVNSCTDALYFALVAAGVEPGHEVLVPDFSFVASASPILRAGAVPVFVDVGDDDNLDLEAAARAVGPRTRAMVIVHLYGHMSDPDPIEGFATRHGLALIEDAAQAIGAGYAGRPAGSVGLASCISFDPTKTVSAPGSGGVVLTDHHGLADRVARLRYHGKAPDGAFVEVGYNSQMPSATAAVLAVKLARNQEWIERRAALAGLYRRLLAGSAVVPPPHHPEALHVYHKFVVRLAERDRVRKELAADGVETMVHYPIPLHAQPLFRSGGVYSPRAEALAREVLSLPIHPFLTEREVETVATALRAATQR